MCLGVHVHIYVCMYVCDCLGVSEGSEMMVIMTGPWKEQEEQRGDR